MTVDLLHPEALLDREREAQLTAEESEQLQRHLRECGACRLERALRQTVELPLTRDEERLAERAADRAAQLFLQPVSRPKSVSTRLVRWGVLVASGTLVAVGFAAVGRWLALRPEQAAPSTSTPAVVVQLGSDTTGTAVPPAPAENADNPPLQASPPAPATRQPANVERAGESPSELFARANRARRQDQSEGAAALYRELQSRFPRSNEALVSCVTLGRLMLDRLNQPSGALAQFDRYLDAVPGGGLREEAIIGRALAFGRLGRAPEEHTAWQELLKEYPDSMYSERARARLAP
jgi:hypothetical protein